MTAKDGKGPSPKETFTFPQLFLIDRDSRYNLPHPTGLKARYFNH
jgi:hypothetical protein